MRQTTIAVLLATAFAAAPALAQQDGIPALDHVFVIVLENHGFSQIIGNPNAPAINALAAKYNLATNYTGVWNPSLPNYLAMIAGDHFGVSNDDAPTVTNPPGPWSFNAPTVGSQLEAIAKDWRDYQEDIPSVGSLVSDWPGDANTGSIYAVKHNPFPYFQVHQTQAGYDRMVPFTELIGDLTEATTPAFSLIIPNQCNNMHSQDYPLSPCAGDNDATIVARGDQEVGMIVHAITRSSVWKEGRNAVFIVSDEAEHKPLSTPVVAIAITNYGVRGVQDTTPYSHYSLLKTIEAGFGLPYLGHAADPGTLTMAPMLAPRKNK